MFVDVLFDILNVLKIYIACNLDFSIKNFVATIQMIYDLFFCRCPQDVVLKFNFYSPW